MLQNILQKLRRLISIVAIAALWNSSIFVTAIADDQEEASAHEYKARIVLIVNFLKFVDWPGDDAPRKTNKATVCILGDRDFSDYFRTALGANKGELSITIDDSVSGKDIANCNILFIGKKQEDNVSSIMAYVKHHPVLSISETKDFTDMGGIVEIVRVGKSVGLFYKDKIGFRINLRTAQEENLNIDARVLQIATEVIK